MSVSDHERAQLTNWLEEHMGAERATAMMKLLPPVGWGDLATRRDLQFLEDKLDRKIDLVAARLDARIDLLGQRLDARIDRMEDRLEAMAATMATMATKADITESRAELQRTLVTWILASQGIVVAAIGVFIGFLR
jgi:hypothetical protein